MKRLTVLVTILLMAGVVYAQEWHIETVDSNGEVGLYNSLALDSSGYPHISYRDHTNNNLKYARWDGGEWRIETVDSGGNVGFYTSLALDSSDHPHISYYDSTNGDLKYARWDGDEWHIETVDSNGDVGIDNSLALDSSDYPHISYCDCIDISSNLKHARWDGDEWHIETVDTDEDVGFYTSLAFDSSDYPHISYCDYYHCDLKYARWDGSAWQIETLIEGLCTSLALDSSDYPHISYYDVTYESLKYARWDGDEWQLETVDSSGSVGEYNSLAMDSSKFPHISYFDRFNSALKYAHWDGDEWQVETVDSDGNVGDNSSLALDSSDCPHISYSDSTNGDLKYAWYESGPGVEGAELSANVNDEGVLVGWEIVGDTPASLRILRSAGEGEPVAVSGPLPGEALRWLDTNAYDASDKGLKPLAYWLETTDADGTVSRFGPSEAVTFPGSARGLALSVYPSPAADTLTVAFTLPSEGRVTVALYDLSGRRVATVYDGQTAAGRHELSGDVSALTPGVYLARLSTDAGTLTRRVVVAR
jgi:hypothetical protein